MPDEVLHELPQADTPTYRQESWSGIPHYVCLACAASSFHLDRMADHQRETHDGRMVEEPQEESSQDGAGQDVSVSEPAPVVNDVNDAGQPILPEDEKLLPEEPPHA